MRLRRGELSCAGPLLSGMMQSGEVLMVMVIVWEV